MAFKKPEKLISGTKILIFGEAGTKKSRTALTFPRIAYIDSDQGADNYFEEFKDNLVLVSDSTTFAEVISDLDDVESDADNIDTIVLDSITKIYENQQHTALRVVEQRAMKNGRLKEGEGLSPKEWGVIKLNHEKMLSKLFELKKEGKIIIVISEGKDEKEAIVASDGSTSFRKIGITTNASKGIEFDFDIVLEMVRDPKSGKTIGAKVLKDRLGVISEGELVESPSYSIWAETIERRRQGTAKATKRNLDDDLDRDAKTFSADSNIGKIAEIIADINSIVTSLDKEGQKKVAATFKEKFGTMAFKELKDAKVLNDMLEVAKANK